MLKCEKGCGKCCQIGGTDKRILMTYDEAVTLGIVIGRQPAQNAGRPLSKISLDVPKGGSCPAYVDGACTAYDARPQVCRTYFCNGVDQWVKSEESMVASIDLAGRMVERNDIADVRNWFPEGIDSVLARHERIAFQFSGGKDSTAMLLKMRPYWHRFTVYFCNSGDVLPETLELVDHFRKILPNFVEIAGRTQQVRAEFGMPTDVLPWSSAAMAHYGNVGFTPLMQDRVSCCFRSVMAPLHERMIADGVTLIIRGQKNKDVLKGRFVSGDIADGIEFLYPMEDLTDEQCFQIMRDNGVTIPRYYSEGLVHSGDCSTCTAWVHEENRAVYLKKYYPERYETYRRNIITIAAAAEESVVGLLKAVEHIRE